MSIDQILKNPSLKSILIVIGWIILSALLFTGHLEITTEGNLEISIIMAFALLVLVLHLFSILKKLSHNYL